MLEKFSVYAILPAKDVERAKSFYTEKLGLKMIELFPGEVYMFEAAGGSKLVIYRKPEGTKAEHTVAGFDVEKLEEVMKELESKGVMFEYYPELEGMDEATKIMSYGSVRSAWFKDSEGNIIALNEVPSH